MYYDIHTHKERSMNCDTLAIRSIRVQEFSEQITADGFFSAGWHPWDSGAVAFEMEKLTRLAANPAMVAVGECGLDKLRGANMTIQAGLFRQQAFLAESAQKPLIIHCVQAWQEIISIKKDIIPDMPWIIHGFRGKPELARQLADYGFYLSFGESLLKENSPAAASLKQVPSDRFFLETDESLHTISEIHEAAALIKSLSLAELQTCVEQNIKTVFRIDGTSRMASKD